MLAAGPLFLPPFYVRVGQLMLYSAGLGLAWAILGGFAGYASFGHAAFIGVGAFTAGLVESSSSSLPPALLLPLGLAAGGACCAILSAVIAYPILRLRGTFFAIAMLGVSHVCAEVTNNIDFFQGSLGLNFPPIAPASMDPASFFYELYLLAGARRCCWSPGRSAAAASARACSASARTRTPRACWACRPSATSASRSSSARC